MSYETHTFYAVKKQYTTKLTLIFINDKTFHTFYI